MPFTGATLSVGGGLSLNGNTLYFDMSNSSTGANDNIVMNGGALTLAGTQYFQFLLLQNTLAAGIYDLVTGAASISASGYTLAHNLPVGSRQIFDLSAVGATLRLTVTGDPASLTWTGTTSAYWDTATADNWSGATPNIFGSNDAVVFDDTSGNHAITLVGTIAPRSIVINTAAGYTFAGGGIAGTGTLTKTGAGALSLANTGASTFSGGTFLNGGGVILTDSTANSSGLGTGAITLNGGTLTMAGFNGSNSLEFAPMPHELIIPAGATGYLNLTQRAPKPGAANVFPAINGTLSGGGTLNLAIKFVRGDVLGDWSAFSGHLSTNIAGRVDLVIDDSDEDGLPDSWELTYFNSLAQIAAGDSDSDGTSNLAEYRLNLNPSNGGSAFRAGVSGHTLTWPSAQGIVFTVKRTLSLDRGTWETIGTVTGNAGITATFTDPSSFEKAFYRVEFVP